MKINRRVLDLSHHESIQSYDALKTDGIIGIIYKATQGTQYRDPTYHTEKIKALEAGLLWGSYHFLEKSNIETQVENFLSYANPQPNELFALDYEDYGSKTPTLNDAKTFIQLAEEKLNRPNACLIYSGNTIKEALGNKIDPFWSAHRLWLAQYGNTPITQPSWTTYFLWQYSDGELGPQPHSINGTKDYVDSNHFNGSPQQLIEQWSGYPTTPAVPLPPQQTVTITISTPPSVNVQIIYV